MAARAVAAAVLLGLCGAGAALAQDEYAATERVLDEMMQGCLANSEDREGDAECASLMTQVCIAMGPGSDTTYGLNSCTAVLWGLWDKELNRLWPELLAQQAAAEAEALRARQRAWIAQRDAACDAAAAEMGGGSAATFTLNGCLQSRTEDRVAEFRDMLEIAGPKRRPSPGTQEGHHD